MQDISTGTAGSTNTMGNLNQLETLLASNNRLSGPIPSTLGNLVNLSDLDLGGNQLTGTIPSTLAYLTTLQYLNLQNNTELSGEIPSSLCSIATISIYIDCGNIVCSCCSSYDPESGNQTKCA